ncbi:unnamed protein product [Cuscuta campestris]|uniref:Aminotransferase-like plant mobile domain-containing protein n=1 Tax=Cuscuta campestris TaxID=132261 RepID=A0A484L783_9ASTE|nr:unnamed protein product [Cuscuta campestris]
MNAIVLIPVGDHNAEVDFLQHARALMLKVMGGALFSSTTGNKVNLCLLELLAGTVQDLRSLAIGTEALACLYSILCHAALSETTQIGGPLILIQTWAWERILMCRPKGVVPPEYGIDAPTTTGTMASRTTHFLEEWEVRQQSVLEIDLDHHGYTNAYRQWYYLYGRRIICNPTHDHVFVTGYVPVNLDVHCLLYSLLDISQRTSQTDVEQPEQGVLIHVGMQRCGVAPRRQRQNQEIQDEVDAYIVDPSPELHQHIPGGDETGTSFFTTSSLQPPFGDRASFSHGTPPRLNDDTTS